MKRVFAHIGFSMALTLIFLNLFSADICLIVSVVLAILFVASILSPTLKQKITVPLCLGSALVACLVFMCGSYVVSQQVNLDGTTESVSFYYVDIPEISDESCTYVVKTTSISNENAPQNIKLKIKTDKPIDADVYQVVNANVRFKGFGSNAFNSHGNFADGIYLYGYVDDEVEITNQFVASPWKWIYNLRQDIINTICDNLKGDAGSLSSALVTGYKHRLSDSLYSAFKYAGVVHLMAVSGFHLTIVTAGVFFILRKLNANERVVAFVGLFFIIICIGLAGFSKSIIRAGIMLAFFLIGDAIGVKADMLNSLGVAVALMCLNPYTVTDVGFQLSVLAILAFVVVLPKMASGKHKRLKETLIAPWVVALFTLPVMYLYFGYISLAGLVGNVIIAPIGSYALVASIINYIAIKIGLLPTVFVAVTKFIIDVLMKLVYFFASLKFAVVPLDNAIEFVLIGVLVLFVVAFISKKEKWIKPITIVAISLISFSVAFNMVTNVNTANVLITQNGAIAVVYKSEGYVYGVKNKSDYYDIKSFLFANHIAYDDLNDYHNLENINAFELNGACAVDVNGITVATGSKPVKGADIIVADGYAYDSNGKINLKNSNVLYKIKSNSTYEIEKM